MKLEKQKKLLWLFDTGAITVDLVKGLVYRHRHRYGFFKRRKPLLGSPDHQGYLQTRICVKGYLLAIRLHQIVYMFKHRGIPEGMTIDHRDNNKLNNRARNLQLLSNADNISKSHIESPRRVRRGEENNKAKLTEVQVLEIRSKAPTHTVAVLAQEYGMTKSPIWSIINRKTWRHI